MNNHTDHQIPPRRDPFEIAGRIAARRPTDHTPPTPTPGGDWQWATRNTPGYSYPEDAHLVTLPLRIPPRRHQFHLRTAVAAGAVLLALAVMAALITIAHRADRAATGPQPVPAITTTALSVTAPHGGWWPGPFTAPRKTVQINPYTDSGVWIVGTGHDQIPPGRYQVQVTGELGGYLARCATPDVCEDKTTGLIANWQFPVGAPMSTVDISPTDYSVRTSGVRLTPA